MLGDFCALTDPDRKPPAQRTGGLSRITLAVLIALALLSYSPHDASLNVSAQPPDAHPARNWIGPAGAYSADLIFQVFWLCRISAAHGHICAGPALVSQPDARFAARETGRLACCWCFRLPALLALWRIPEVRGRDPARWIAGYADGRGAARDVQFSGGARRGGGCCSLPRCF